MFNNIKVSTKLLSLVVLLACLTGVVGFIGYYFNAQSTKALSAMYEENLITIRNLNLMRANTRAVTGDTIELITANVSKAREEELTKEIQERVKNNNEIILTFEKGSLVLYETERLPKMKEELKLFRETRKVALELVAAGKREEAYTFYLKEAVPHYENFNNYIVEISNFNVQEAEIINENNKASAIVVEKIMITIPILTMVLAIVLGTILVRSIFRRLHVVIEIANEVASGNLAHEEITIEANDEIGAIGKALNTMVKSLRNLVSEVSLSAQQVAASSEQLTANADQSADVASQVAESITETASSIEQQNHEVGDAVNLVEQMSVHSQQGAENAANATAITNKAVQATQEGNKTIENAITQMVHIQKTIANSGRTVSELGEQSKEIGQIVETISGIASQTNLLALNAAIEAARAGEQGKGFAVVAEEVRKLAEQSQEAAKQIFELISGVQAKTDEAVTSMKAGTSDVEVGIAVVNNAGKAFKEIETSVKQAAELSNNIAHSLTELAENSKQVVLVVHGIGKESSDISGQAQTISAATEEQAASMQEIAAGSRSLAMLAQKLQDEVVKFSL